ncbi:MAG: acyl-CoA dehydrogenase family protein [Deltaproteobacteria bacterium]
MNLQFSDDQKFVQRTAREFLDANATLDVDRAVFESDSSYDEGLWKKVAEMGWLGAAVPEAYGGTGLGHLELCLLAQEMGRALAPIPFASSVYGVTEAILLFGSEEQKKKWLPQLSAGARIGCVAFSEGLGEVDPAGLETSFSDGVLTGTKAPVLDGDIADLAVVLVREGEGASLVLVELAAAGVTREKLASFDASRSQAKLSFEGTPAERLGAAGEGAANFARLLDHMAVLMGFEQIGGTERALDISVAYVKERYAFGRAVGSFQAVKHRLADFFARKEIALSNAYWAAWALSTNDPELSLAACNLRVAASDAFVLGAEDMIQVHGGVGFTWEFDCHLFYRRAKVLAATLGSPSAWREKLISRLEASAA